MTRATTLEKCQWSHQLQQSHVTRDFHHRQTRIKKGLSSDKKNVQTSKKHLVFLMMLWRDSEDSHER